MDSNDLQTKALLIKEETMRCATFDEAAKAKAKELRVHVNRT